LIGYGSFPLVYPNTNNVGSVGQANNIWSAAYLGNAYLYHASNDAVSSVVRFNKARGTLAVPLAVQSADELGSIDFYGYPVGAYTRDARIFATCASAAPNYGAGLSFSVTPRAGALAVAMYLDGGGVAANTRLIFYNAAEVRSAVNNTGVLGNSALRWAELYVYEAYIYGNVHVGGGAVGGGANLTVLLANTSTMPVPQANQVYLGSVDWAGATGAATAVLAVSAEKPAISDDRICDSLIPIQYNGVSYLLLAFDDSGG
jgi:hypothetical protein